MVLAGVDFWYDNYGLWPWQTKPRPKTNEANLIKLHRKVKALQEVSCLLFMPKVKVIFKA